MTMREALASDLSNLYAREMTKTVEIKLNGQVKAYTVLMDDMALESQLNFGGPEDTGMRQVRFKTTDLADIENGTTIMILEPVNKAGITKRTPKIVISSMISACDNELIVTVKGK